jgi:hypothetical protein
MWWKIIIIVVLLQFPLAILVGRAIKFGSTDDEEQMPRPSDDLL